ncbi:hypothetical protein ACU8M5_23520 [Rhizobium leguminosarum]|uniref:hypothetical protein n=1 Tax=Rhizobium leguminosarum TaxID=384 RepID=UPI00103F054B|nr:hypothetical protein [Rhizobium leguminosarum]TBY41177.1 hypothetical protein E0H60_09630 [Rhizobium leguminosarum bv. viciae]
MEFDFVTTEDNVATYRSSHEIFVGLIREVRELSRKKPEATMSTGKVKIVNRVIEDLLTFLKDGPEGKYLEVLDTQALPQVSDAVLTMVQFETAIDKFRDRHLRRVEGKMYWITKELLASWEEKASEAG